MSAGFSIVAVYVVGYISNSGILAILINIFYLADRTSCSQALHPYAKIWI